MPRKRRTQKHDPALDRFAQEFKAEHKNTEQRIHPSGEISMSDAISLLVKPYLEDFPDLASFEVLVSFACLAWNMTNLPAKERQAQLNEMIATAPDLESRVESLALVMDLMEKKEMLFPDVKRMIVKYKVTEQGKDFHISIASTLDKKGDPK